MRLTIDVTNGTNVFFTSDFHLFHAKVVKYDKRPFVLPNGEADLQKMHSTIVKNWNDTVGHNDVVFYLGDLTWSHFEQTKNIMNQLNGRIHYIMGNHDKYEEIKKLGRFENIYDYVDLFLHVGTKEKLHFALMHYPIFSHNRERHGSYHVHGHCHGNLHHGEKRDYYNGKKAVDAGCMIHDYTPISYEQVMKLTR